MTKSLIYFIPCREDSAVADKEASCYSNEQVDAWQDENNPFVQTIFSFSFIDYESTDLPFRQTIAEGSIGETDMYTSYEVLMPL